MRVPARSCWSPSLSLSILLVSSAAAQAPDPAGGIGGSTLAGTLTVRVVEADTLDPIGGALVLAGPAAGVPFNDNVGVTDGSGEIVFSNPALTGAISVTAGASGRAYVSYLDVPSSEVVLALDSLEPEPLVQLGDQFSGIEVANGFLCSGDGNLDIGLVFSTVPLARALGGSGLLDQFFSTTTEPLSLPLGQQAEVPSNITAPVQCELFGNYQKTTYHLGVPPGKRSIYGLSMRGPLSAFLDLANSPELGFNAFISLIGQMTFREIDVLRDLDVAAPLNTVDLVAATPLQTNLTLEVSNALPGRSVIAAAGGRLTNEDGAEELIITGLDAFDPDSVGSSATMTASTAAATGELADLVHGALVIQIEDDDGVSRAGSTSIMRRSGVTPPATLAFSTFFDVVEPVPAGATGFAWNDVRLPGSPAVRHLNVSRLLYEREVPNPQDPLATLTESRTYWVLHGSGNAMSLTLPVLPPGAPVSLPDPVETAEQDTLVFANDVHHLGDYPGTFSYAHYATRDVASYATHVGSGSSALACDTVSEIGGLRLGRDAGSVVLTWDPSGDACHASGNRGYEIYAGDDASPAAEPGSWPTDPPMSIITDEDQDGSFANESFTHPTPEGRVFYLVVDRGSSGNEGPSGHYGSSAP